MINFIQRLQFVCEKWYDEHASSADRQYNIIWKRKKWWCEWSASTYTCVRDSNLKEYFFKKCRRMSIVYGTRSVTTFWRGSNVCSTSYSYGLSQIKFIHGNFVSEFLSYQIRLVDNFESRLICRLKTGRNHSTMFIQLGYPHGHKMNGFLWSSGRLVYTACYMTRVLVSTREMSRSRLIHAVGIESDDTRESETRHYVRLDDRSNLI